MESWFESKSPSHASDGAEMIAAINYDALIDYSALALMAVSAYALWLCLTYPARRKR